VFQFYRQETERCKIFDKHLKILAHKHPETKFAKIDAEKCPFLTDRLKVRVIPTLALIKDAKTRDFVVGFTDLGNTDEFSTEMLEWRLARSELINYSGDLMTPPDQRKEEKPSKVAEELVEMTTMTQVMIMIGDFLQNRNQCSIIYLIKFYLHH